MVSVSVGPWVWVSQSNHTGRIVRRKYSTRCYRRDQGGHRKYEIDHPSLSSPLVYRQSRCSSPCLLKADLGWLLFTQYTSRNQRSLWPFSEIVLSRNRKIKRWKLNPIGVDFLLPLLPTTYKYFFGHHRQSL